MYNKRVKIFIFLSGLLLLVCVLRLGQMQLMPNPSLQNALTELQQGRSRQLQTVRGKILDRNGEVLALDQPRFQLCIEYELSCFLDERVRNARLLRAAGRDDSDKVLPRVRKELQAGLENLQRVVEKCRRFGFSPEEVENRIRQINDTIWNLRVYLVAWRDYPDVNFTEAVPDANDRLLLAAGMDIVEMHESWPLLDLETDNDVFAAQMEFMDSDMVHIQPGGRRFYPYGSVAAQTIGWVGPATGDYRKLFEEDRLASYLKDEVCGKEPGAEYVCEAVLRGRRGELVYDRDSRLIGRTDQRFGQDVTLALDVKLQQRIESYLVNYQHDPNCGPGMSAVVIDVASGEILALVSLPVFDLNRARYDYDVFVNAQDKPMINRAINKQYPPGSVIKPIILIAGLQSGRITPDEIISCPAEKAPTGWPSCWIFNTYGLGHDGSWLNNARNAIKGSCNIYFSRLADRIEPEVLQQWLFKFGYGHVSSLVTRDSSFESRQFRQTPGQIYSGIASVTASSFEQIPPLSGSERRLFGIGQGNLRVTPLQVANAMAAIARNGIYKSPQLLRSPAGENEEIDLGISPQTLDVVRDGMHAVVNEYGGTAYNEFAHSGLGQQGVEVYGKTGSTEAPSVAWFAGFAQESRVERPRSIAIAIAVEGGQHGSSDAAPLAREIIQFCIEAGYIGKPAY